MPNSSTTLVNFNAGEWTPRLAARSDLAKAKAACRTLRNMTIREHGPAIRRPGTQFVAQAKVAT